MRLVNLLAMALVMSTVVVAAFAAKHASPPKGERIWREAQALPLDETIIDRRHVGLIEGAAGFRSPDAAIGGMFALAEESK